jgi:hypothetical protein
MGNDNAERDKARQRDEDLRFLDELARREAQQTAEEERRKQKLKEDKVNYRRQALKSPQIYSRSLLPL